jgi:transposase-like protein
MTRSITEACPECGSQLFKKNGHIHNGKQNHQCKTCGRQFVVDATNRVIDAEHRSVVERLLCEKISLRENPLTRHLSRNRREYSLAHGLPGCPLCSGT